MTAEIPEATLQAGYRQALAAVRAGMAAAAEKQLRAIQGAMQAGLWQYLGQCLIALPTRACRTQRGRC